MIIVFSPSKRRALGAEPSPRRLAQLRADYRKNPCMIVVPPGLFGRVEQIWGDQCAVYRRHGEHLEAQVVALSPFDLPRHHQLEVLDADAVGAGAVITRF